MCFRGERFRLYYVPDCDVQHKQRATLLSHLRQVYISGPGRVELMKRSGLRGQVLYLAPLSFFLCLPFAGMLARRVPAVLAPLALDGVLAAALSISAFLPVAAVVMWTGALMFASHIAYAIGLFRGLVAAKGYQGKALAVEVVETAAANQR
jgi:hypothetical protein